MDVWRISSAGEHNPTPITDDFTLEDAWNEWPRKEYMRLTIPNRNTNFEHLETHLGKASPSRIVFPFRVS